MSSNLEGYPNVDPDSSENVPYLEVLNIELYIYLISP